MFGKQLCAIFFCTKFIILTSYTIETPILNVFMMHDLAYLRTKLKAVGAFESNELYMSLIAFK